MGGSVPNLQELEIFKAEGDMLNFFRREVEALLHVDGFPGAQPVSFNRKHLDELRHRDYYVCEKSDGIRTLLYFTKQNGGNGLEEMHFLIDRKNDFYVVPGLHFPLAPEDPREEINFASWHCDTLLDGELLWDTYPDGRRELKYLVFDSLCVDGKVLIDRPLPKRLAYFIDKIYKPYEELRRRFPDDCRSFKFKMEQKSFQLAYGTEMMFRDILPKLPHGNDGLIFTCTETPYKFKTDEHILKWKPAEENTIDFRMGLEFPPVTIKSETQDHDDAIWEYDYDAMPKFTLWDFHGDKDGDQYFGELHVTSDEYNTMKQWSVERDDGLDGQVVECHIDSDGRWRFSRFRDDKLEANHFTVVRKVMDSIRDGVTREELVASAGSIRSAWKAPEREKRRAVPPQPASRPLPKR